MITYNKLVRDGIPDIIRDSGKKCNTEVLDEERFFSELNRKLKEEVEEYLAELKVEELADIAEVIYALAKWHGVSKEELEDIRLKKKKQRAGLRVRLSLLG
mgnify:CR=1 FL=1